MSRAITRLALALLALAALPKTAAAQRADLDILFVIDNSGSMSQEQISLTSAFPSLIQELELAPGGLPNLHLGVVSSDVGIGGYSQGGCSGDGDNGRLQNTARAGACQPPQGFFVVDRIDPTIKDLPGTPENEAHITNYSGTIQETFSCIAQLGSAGCGLEQHLEAMFRAFDGRNSENSQFIRRDDPATPANDEAYLAVIIIADEDDCSALDSTVFDPSQDDISDPLGPFSSFRCTEFGVQCTSPTTNITRTAASYTGCTAKESPVYMEHPTVYADRLKALKVDPNRVFVGVIAGDAAPFDVGLDTSGEPFLDWSCSSLNGNANPGVRFRRLLEDFVPERGEFQSICGDDLSGPVAAIGAEIRSMLESPPPTPDAGTPDAAAPGLTDGGGCGCQAGGASPGGGAFLLLAAALLVRRRRVTRR